VFLLIEDTNAMEDGKDAGVGVRQELFHCHSFDGGTPERRGHRNVYNPSIQRNIEKLSAFVKPNHELQRQSFQERFLAHPIE